MKMITALLKASFLLVLSMLLFSTTSQAQSNTQLDKNQIKQLEASNATKADRLTAQGITYEKASADLVMWQAALGNLPTQGAEFTPEQYQLAENWIKQNLSATEMHVNVLKPVIQHSEE